MSRVLGIIGAGDLGQQIAHYAVTDMGYDRVLFFDDFITKAEAPIDEVEKYYQQNSFQELVIAIGYNHLPFKQKIAQRFEQIPMATLIHSSAFIDPSATIDKGVVIFPRCIIDKNVKIGAFSLLNIGASVSHDTQIGDYCFISPRVALAGFIQIGDYCILGINSTVIDNINITNNTQIGGGSVVIKSLEKSGLYVGNPARWIR